MERVKYELLECDILFLTVCVYSWNVPPQSRYIGANALLFLISKQFTMQHFLLLARTSENANPKYKTTICYMLRTSLPRQQISIYAVVCGELSCSLRSVQNIRVCRRLWCQENRVWNNRYYICLRFQVR